MLLFRPILFALGLLIVGATLASAIRTFVLPRSATDPLTGVVFRGMRQLFRPWTRAIHSYEQRDQVMALFAPLSLLALLPTWYLLTAFGYALMFFALQGHDWRFALKLSGSSLLTLGFSTVDDLPRELLIFSEATIGLILVALLISYLPTMYTAFARREAAVALLEVRAGSPPSALELLKRHHRLGRSDQLATIWQAWEVWFSDIEESHTSLAALVFFRSPQPDRSWVTASGAILDAAALYASTLDVPRDPQAELCLRAGYVALRRIADLFRIRYNPAPAPSDPISISREEFLALCEELAAAGLTLKSDREQAWQGYRGWRVNYDTVLLALAALTMAPHAPWSSDRSLAPLPRR